MIMMASCSPQSIGSGSTPRSVKDYEPAVSHLTRENDEAPGYGLYTYVIMTKFSEEKDKELLKTVLSEIYYQFGSVEEVAVFTEKKEDINLIYIPIKTTIEINENVFGDEDFSKMLAEKVTVEYDKIRAKKLIKKVKKGLKKGPYLVTTYAPVRSDSIAFDGEYLIQDLSGTNPRVAKLWVDKYISIASSPANWNGKKMAKFAIRVRDTMASIADELDDIIESNEKWSATLANKIFWNS